MTKVDLAEKIRDRLGFRRNVSLELVESVLGILKETLEGGEDVKITGFGIFQIKKKADRPGRNPITGEALVIPGRKVLTFKVSPVLKAHVNG